MRKKILYIITPLVILLPFILTPQVGDWCVDDGIHTTTSDAKATGEHEGRYYTYAYSQLINMTEIQSPNFNLTNHLETLAMQDPLFPPVVPIRVLVMADEEFRQKYPNWKDYTYSWIERSDNEVYCKFNIDMEVTGYLEWFSEAKTGDLLLDEAIAESYNEIRKYPYVHTVVLAFTSVNLGLLVGLADSRSCAILVTPYTYWADDNLLMHELSHLYFAHDHLDETDPHYKDDCIMSYDLVWVEFWFEDGGIWWVHDWVPKIFVTKNYCHNNPYPNCFLTVYVNALRFNPPTMHTRRYKV